MNNNDKDKEPMPINDFANQIICAEDPESLKDLTQLFNFNQAKKNLLRLSKLSELSDDVIAKIEQRLYSRPDNFSNKDLLDYLSVIQGVLDKQQKSQDTILDKPMIKYQQNNQVNVNITQDLSRESRDKITDLIQEIIKSGNIDDLKLLESIEVEDDSNE